LNRKNKAEYRKINDWEDWEYRQKEGKGNFCFLVNEFCCEVDALEKILSMKKIDYEKIINLIKDFSDEISIQSDKEVPLVNCFEEIIGETNLPAFTNDIEDIYTSIERSMGEAIEANKRNKTLLKIAVYNKSKGMSAEDNEKFLIDFSSDKKHKYKTSIEDNINEIRALIKTIYFSDTANKYKLAIGIKDLIFTKDEIFEILTIKQKSLRKLYFVIFAHFKLYGDKNNNTFYMKYERIRNLLNVDGKTINKGLLELEHLNKIEFIRKGKRDEKSPEYKNLANIYRLKYKIQEGKGEKGYKLLCGKEGTQSEGTLKYMSFEMMCAKALSKDEIEKNFTNSSQIIKYKYQQLKEVS